MARARGRRLLIGTLAGIAGGVAASWAMNMFTSAVGDKLTRSLMSDEDRLRQKRWSENREPKEDATMKAAEDIVHAASGGRHLSHEERKQAGPVVHYAFGALAGGLYGALSECSHWTSLGFGTVFGALLYASADLTAVPALRLGPSVKEEPLAAQATPFAAHLLYGATTDLVRRAIRAAA